MGHVIFWSKRAQYNLDSALTYISENSSEINAKKVYAKILKRSNALQKNPDWIGIPVKEYPGCGYKSITAAGYRIIFRLETERVCIVAVVHRRMLISDL